MPINFPNNPSNGDTTTINGVLYTYDSTNNSWKPSSSTDFSTVTNTPTTIAGYGITDAFDGQYSSLIGAPTSSTAGALGTLTKTFAQNEESEITLSENISPVPNVSVFKEVPQGGLTSKGNWDVNANATNYDFFDEKPISYTSTTLTPSAIGDGTFTSSNPTLVGYDVSGISSVGDYETYTPVSQVPNPPTNAYTLADFVISPDGTKIIIVSSQRMHEFTMSTAYDITSASWTQRYDYDAYNPSTWGGYGFLELGDSGSKLYMADWQNHKIDQFTLSTPYSLGNGGSDVSFSGEVTGMNNSGSNQTQNGMYVKDSTTVFIMKDDVSGNQAIIEEWVMSTAWDITTLSYNNKTKSITGQRGTDMTFSSDGLTMFITDVFGSGTLKYFSLGTAWDISTINTTGTTFTNPALTNSTPQAINFSKSGTKLYMADGTKIYEQDTGYSEVFSSTDVGKKVVGNSGSAIITSTAGAYTSVTPFADTSAISSWQLFGAQGKSDGTGVELSGYSTQSDIVFPTGASGSGASMVYNNNVSAEFTNLRSVVFNSAGTIALVMTSGTIQRYNLSTAFDLSTLAAVTGDSFGGQLGTSQYGLGVSSDGTKLFVSDYSNDLIKQFTLSTPWSPSTQTYNGYYSLNSGGSWNSFSGGGGAPSTTNFNPFDFQFNSDGTKLLTILYDNAPYHSVAEFSLSTGWDLSTMTYVSYANFDNAGDPDSIAVSSDGLKIMLKRSGLAGTEVEVYSLPSAFSVGSAGNNLTKTAGTIELSTLTGDTNGIGMGGLIMSSDGKRMWTRQSNKFYEITGGTSSVHPYSTYSPALTNSTGQINSTSWTDIDSMVADETKNDGDVFYAVSTDDRTSWGVIKDGDGVRKIARNNSGTWQYNNDAGSSVSVGFGLSSPSYDSKSYTVPHSSPRGMYLKSDGTELYIGAYTGHVYQYTLSTPNDISTASSTGNYNIDEVYDTVALTFKPDGTKMYATGGTVVYQYTLSTAWDITTASYDSVSYTPSDMGSSDIHSLNFNSDGTKLFMSDDGTSDKRIREYSLSTPYVVSSASTTSNYLYHNKAGVRGVDFNSDGTKIFLSSYSTQTVYQYNLASAYTLSSSQGTTADVEYDASSTIPSNLYSIAFSNDGTKLFILESSTPSVKQFSTTSTTTGYGTSETWVDGTNNNEHATLQEALGAQSFNRMDKAQLQAVTDPNHYVLGDTLDLMIAPYATSGTSPLSDGVTIGYQAEALVRQAINGTDYEAEFPALNKVKIKSLASQNLKIRII